MLHWIINPGLVINELLLGQRVPKIIWVKVFSGDKGKKTKLILSFHFLRSLVKPSPDARRMASIAQHDKDET